MDNYVVDLLFEHDCVILPGFGGFVLNYREAIVDFRNQKLSPPSRVVAFNQNLNTNDGLLANYVARTENIGYAEASEKINKYISHIRQQLDIANNVSVQGIGYFTISNAVLEFHPDLQQNFLRDAYGLAEFHFPLLKSVKPQEVIEQSAKEVGAVAYSVKHRKPGWAVAITTTAAAIVLLVLFISNNNFMKGIQHHSEMNPVHIPQKITLPTVVPNNAGNETTPDNTEIVPEQPNQETVETSDDAVVAIHGSVHVIAGSFSNRENADALVQRLRDMGFEAVILPSNDAWHRVSVQSFARKEDAYAALTALRERTDNAALWVMAD